MVCELAEDIAGMIETGWKVVVTHGNGPQVGFILRRSELSIAEVPPVPMDYAGADIQGAVGYMFLKALRNAFGAAASGASRSCVVTQTVVDRDDPAFANPDQADRLAHGRGARQGARRRSRLDGARGCRAAAGGAWCPRRSRRRSSRRRSSALARPGLVVVACGGGGIPVIEDENGDLTASRR